MAHTSTMTLRLSGATLARLEGLARATERSKAYLAGKAIEEYLDIQEWQVKAIRDAVEEADNEGARFLDHETVLENARGFRLTKKSLTAK